MSIQILKSGIPQSINDVDKLIAEYWGVEVHEKQYASPLRIPFNLPAGERYLSLFEEDNTDWFNSIGLCVHNAQGRINTIEELRQEYFKRMIDKFTLEACLRSEYIRKYWFLLGYLESNDYVIVYVN